MKHTMLLLWLIIFSLQAYTRSDEHLIVFTANQGLLSRIYVMHMDGSVMHYHEYENYRWQDMTVINNEVYVAEALMPGIYKVDIFTGEIELVMHDFWLYYFYGLAWDGTYFYVDEWDLNRYDMEGNKHGTAAFSQTVYGATFANGYYWMLGNENIIRCWDFSDWPQLSQQAFNNFAPPSENCRGLWFDGEYFWTTESIENQAGKIYQFNFQGEVIVEWQAPAFRGWAAVRVENPYVGKTEMTDNEFVMKPFPNPFSGQLYLDLDIDKDTDLKIVMRSAHSAWQSICFEGHLSQGTHNIQLCASPAETEALPPGIYILSIQDGQQIRHHKLIKAY